MKIIIEMKYLIKTMLGLLSVILLTQFSCEDPDVNPEVNSDPMGKILCNDKGVENVVVTDGTHFTVSDTGGNFTLPYNSSANFIFISSPAGYSVPVNGSVPVYWKKLSSISDKKNITFTLFKSDFGDLKHYFIALGDPQVRNEDELTKLQPILQDIKEYIQSNDLSAVHLMVAGDIVFDTPDMHTLSKSYYTDLQQAVYYAIGNHDHIKNTDQSASDAYDKTADNVFESHYGPTYYSFNKGNAHYIVFDNIFYRGGPSTEYSTYITQEQLDWIRKDLSYVSKDKILILMCHSPTKTRFSGTRGNSDALYNLLSGYNDVHIISGHTHYNSMVFDNTNITEHTVGAACGGFWEGPVCLCGTKLGYKLFTIDNTEVSWEYIDYTDHSKQFTVFKPGDRATGLPPSEELLVNVWDWDTGWEVSWSEDDGASFMSMTRYANRAYDPLAYEYFGMDGDNTFPVGRGWIDANPTDHLFTCTPSAGTSRVIIKTVNHFGKEHTADVIL